MAGVADDMPQADIDAMVLRALQSKAGLGDGQAAAASFLMEKDRSPRAPSQQPSSSAAPIAASPIGSGTAGRSPSRRSSGGAPTATPRRPASPASPVSGSSPCRTSTRSSGRSSFSVRSSTPPRSSRSSSAQRSSKRGSRGSSRSRRSSRSTGADGRATADVLRVALAANDPTGTLQVLPGSQRFDRWFVYNNRQPRRLRAARHVPRPPSSARSKQGSAPPTSPPRGPAPPSSPRTKSRPRPVPNPPAPVTTEAEIEELCAKDPELRRELDDAVAMLAAQLAHDKATRHGESRTRRQRVLREAREARTVAAHRAELRKQADAETAKPPQKAPARPLRALVARLYHRARERHTKEIQKAVRKHAAADAASSTVRRPLDSLVHRLYDQPIKAQQSHTEQLGRKYIPEPPAAKPVPLDRQVERLHLSAIELQRAHRERLERKYLGDLVPQQSPTSAAKQRAACARMHAQAMRSKAALLQKWEKLQDDWQRGKMPTRSLTLKEQQEQAVRLANRH
eukprot:TRINITY_DN2091_c0_g2_i2.p1 TRINITY_DN2091_c0_g2~~TRINITY_DN2091_c0_g2_i2.p1  ORF type:complete len:535 (+),score=172.26 TRINITY_DN2091_c0_g2_i2:74-1606(+)